jgi:murein DD-endopeptidase MepM/ murein hydrolase activator NlpD
MTVPVRTIAVFHLAVAALGGFLAGVIVTVVLLGQASERRRASGSDEAAAARAVRVHDETGEDEAAGVARVARIGRPAPAADAAGRETPAIGRDPLAELRRRALIVPVRGVESGDLQGSFEDPRGTSRRHEAIDILAPRHTPVLAVEDGAVARLFTSAAGGLSVYQFDPAGEYVYFYAHLQRYAAGLSDGDAVERGQVLGYVGTTGNAPENTPHLHFAILKLSDDRRWWDGTPIDPLLVLQ